MSERLKTTIDTETAKGVFNEVVTILSLRERFRRGNENEITQAKSGLCTGCIISYDDYTSQVSIKATLNPGGQRFLLELTCENSGHDKQIHNIEIQPTKKP